MKIITEQFIQQRQGYKLVRVVSYDSGARFRVIVYRDSFDFQSYGKAQVWTPEKGWVEVHYIPGEALAWMPSYASKDETVRRTAAEKVYGELLDVALAVAHPAALIGRA